MREFDLDEMEALLKLKEQTNKLEIKLDEKEIKAAHNLLKKNIMHYLSSNIQFHTPKSPRSCYLSLKIDHFSDNITEVVSKILSSISPPYRIYFDFFCLTQSATEPDFQLLHPSIATCFNEKKLIVKLEDKKALLEEFSY